MSAGAHKNLRDVDAGVGARLRTLGRTARSGRRQPEAQQRHRGQRGDRQIPGLRRLHDKHRQPAERLRLGAESAMSTPARLSGGPHSSPMVGRSFIQSLPKMFVWSVVRMDRISLAR
jgi:hypothetical protein